MNKRSTSLVRSVEHRRCPNVYEKHFSSVQPNSVPHAPKTLNPNLEECFSGFGFGFFGAGAWGCRVKQGALLGEVPRVHSLELGFRVPGKYALPLGVRISGARIQGFRVCGFFRGWVWGFGLILWIVIRFSPGCAWA
jgi:hypothetical protein